MTSYSAIHRTNGRYKLTVMSVLIAAFLVAMPLMFVHPTAVILLVWLGLVVMAVAWPVELLFQWAERKAAQKAVRRHECPECGITLGRDAPERADWTCESCGFEWSAQGTPAIS